MKKPLGDTKVRNHLLYTEWTPVAYETVWVYSWIEKSDSYNILVLAAYGHNKLQVILTWHFLWWVPKKHISTHTTLVFCSSLIFAFVMLDNLKPLMILSRWVEINNQKMDGTPLWWWRWHFVLMAIMGSLAAVLKPGRLKGIIVKPLIYNTKRAALQVRKNVL